MLSNNYYFLLKEYLREKRIYDRLDLDEKIEFMNLELRLNGVNIKAERFHTKSESKTNKSITATRMRIKNASKSGL